MTLQIRLAKPDEYDAIGAITVDAYTADGLLHDDSDYAVELRDAAQRAEQAELWVAVADGAVLGSVTYCLPGSPYRELARDGEGEFRMLAVSPGARRRGAARALVLRCIERSREQGFHRVVLCSLPQMTAAHRLYSDLGFVRTPQLDWEPVPRIRLLGFALDL